MIKKLTKSRLLFLFAFCSLGLQAQQTVDASGGTATGTGGSVTYSVGQVVYSYQTATNGWLIQGVQQPKEYTGLATTDFASAIAQCKLYPNPTTNQLTLSFNSEAYLGCDAVLTDLSGKQLLQLPLCEANTTLQLEQLPAATYLLSVTKNNQTVQSFKIVKN